MKESQEIPELVEDHQLPTTCMLFHKRCCPFPALSIFWKVTIGSTAVLMLVFSLTLWLMASTMMTQNKEIKELRVAMVIDHNAESVKIDGHKQLTMDNRVVTSRIEGMLNVIVNLFSAREAKK